MRLLLFDIDGTLIHSNHAGRAALIYALEEVFGTAGPIDAYQMAGKTDPLIISDLLHAAGLETKEIEAGLQRAYELMAERGQTIFQEKGIRPCPGVPELLEILQKRGDVFLGLVTGNINLTAPLKLAAAGIDPTIFRAGAYGSDNKDRNVLPSLAIQRACDISGWSLNGESTIVIGDTPADILCARAAGATAVAVATGSHSSQTLAEYSPDFLLENLKDTDAVLQIMLHGKGDSSDERDNSYWSS